MHTLPRSAREALSRSDRSRVPGAARTRLAAAALALVAAARAQTVVGALPLPGQSIGAIAVDPRLDRVYVGGGFTQTALTVVDVSAPSAPVAVTILPLSSAATLPSIGRLYASTGGAGGIAVRDASSLAPLTDVHVGYCGGALDADPARGLVYMTSQCGGGNDPLHVLDASNDALVAGPLGTGGVATGVVVAPATGRVYASHAGGTRVFDGPPGFAFVADLPGRALCADASVDEVWFVAGGNLEVLDGKNHARVATIAGVHGASAAIDTRKRRAFVADPAGGVLHVIDTQSHARVASLQLAAGVAPRLVAVDETKGRVYAVGTSGGGTSTSSATLFVLLDLIDVDLVAADPALPAPCAIALDGASLLVGNAAPIAIRALPRHGGPSTPRYGLATPHRRIAGLVRAGDDVFWIDPDSGPAGDTQIFRAPADGRGPVTAIYTGSASGQPIVAGSDLASDGVWLYSADSHHGRVHRVGLGGGVQQLGPDRFGGGIATQHPSFVAERRGTLFVCDSGKTGVVPPAVLAIPTGGATSFTTLWAGTPLVAPSAIAAGDGAVFVADPGAANTIWVLPAQGGIPRALVANAPFLAIDDLVFDDGALWVADSAAGRVYRVTTGVERIGTGCAGSGGHVPLLRTHGGLAMPGNAAFGIAVHHGLGGAAAALVVGTDTDPLGTPIGADCRVHLDIALPISLLLPPMFLSPGGPGTGSGSFSLPVPYAPALTGAVLCFQGVVMDQGGGTARLTLTNALEVTVLK